MHRFAASSSLVLFGILSINAADADLSRYREFQFGDRLENVTKATAVKAWQVRIIHQRPVVMQELEWRPQSLGWSSKAEAVENVAFSFYDGELFRMVIDYDQTQTEGLTPADLVEAISANYGVAEKTPTALKGPFGEEKQILARWQNLQYRFDLVRLSYGNRFQLIGVAKELERRAETTILEARRLDVQDAPRREAARLEDEQDAARSKLEKARLVNKPKFRP